MATRRDLQERFSLPLGAVPITVRPLYIRLLLFLFGTSPDHCFSIASRSCVYLARLLPKVRIEHITSYGAWRLNFRVPGNKMDVRSWKLLYVSPPIRIVQVRPVGAV